MRRACNQSQLRWVASLIAGCGAVASAMAADAGYTPTMQDMLSIQATLHRYHEGLDRHDNKLWASAFAEDGTMTLVNHDQQMTLTRAQIAASGLLGSAPPAGDQPPAGMGELWHFSEMNGNFEFESSTRAKHYSYWMEVHVHQDSNSATLAPPGHYEDVLVKRKGEWLLLSRKVVIGEK
jgi:hypothetical protein